MISQRMSRIRLAAAIAVLAAAMVALATAAHAQLHCIHGSGDVTAHPLVTNMSKKSIAKGKKIRVKAKDVGGKLYPSAVETLTSALGAGKQKVMSKSYPWNFTCTATVL